MKPVIALVGRPNVGKSTLFNRLTRSRDAIVADYAGLTRDRHYGEGRMGERPFLVIDTGGFEPVAKDGIYHEMAKQTRQAIDESDLVVFLVDGRAGLNAHDQIIADDLRKTGRPVILAVNKAEGMRHATVTADFYALGLGEPVVISPLYKQRIRLRDGCQVENGEPAVRAWPVKIENGKVWVGNDALVMRAEAS